MSVEAEESRMGPDETGETDPATDRVGDAPEVAEAAPQPPSPVGFLVIAARIFVGVLCLAGLAVFGLVQALGGPGLLLALGSVAAVGAGAWWFKSGQRNSKAKSGLLGAQKRSLHGASVRAPKGASGGMGKRLAKVLPKRSGSGQKRVSGGASGGKPKASKLAGLGKRFAGGKKTSGVGASGALKKRLTGAGRGASGKRSAGSKLNPFKGTGKQSGSSRGGRTLGRLATPFKAGGAKLKARKSARSEAAKGGRRTRVGTAWKASGKGSPRKVWRAARKAHGKRGWFGRTIGTATSVGFGLGFLGLRWGTRSAKRAGAWWWQRNSWRVRNAGRRLANRVRVKLGRPPVALLPAPNAPEMPAWDDEAALVEPPPGGWTPADMEWDCGYCGSPQHGAAVLTGVLEGRATRTCGDCFPKYYKVRCADCNEWKALEGDCPNCAPMTDEPGEWFVANPKENTMSISEAPIPDEDAGMLEVREFVRREQEAAEDASGRAKTLKDLVETSPFNSASREAAEAYIEWLELMAEAAADWAATFDSEHADDFDRLDSPRAGEEKWDKSRNDS